MLGVSRTPVREAMLDLFREGVVEIVPKRGFRLSNLDEGAVEEVRLLRAALERLVVSRLCEVVTDDDIAELRRLLSGQGLDENDIFSIDEALHMRMAEMAGLHDTKRVLLGLRGKMYLIACGAPIAEVRNDQVSSEHSDLLDRLARRDCKGALAVIASHVERSIDSFRAASERQALSREPLPRLS